MIPPTRSLRFAGPVNLKLMNDSKAPKDSGIGPSTFYDEASIIAVYDPCRDLGSLERPAPEKIKELNEEDHYNSRFKKKGATLVELFDHVVVEIFSGLHFS